MTYKGIVKDNKIIIQSPVLLPEGTYVEIIPLGIQEKEDKICGSWHDDRTAEEIIDEIKSSRRSGNKEINL